MEETVPREVVVAKVEAEVAPKAAEATHLVKVRVARKEEKASRPFPEAVVPRVVVDSAGGLPTVPRPSVPFANIAIWP
jgi:hypothetical protein